MLDASIPLQVRIPEVPSAMQSVAGLMGLRDQVSQIALRQQQAELARQTAAENEATAQQKNRDLSDQNTLQAFEKDPEAYADIHSGDPARLAKRLGGQVQPKTLEAVQKYVNGQIEAKATLDKSTLANQSEAHKEIARSVDSLDQMRKADGSLDLDRINQQLPNLIGALGPQLNVLKLDPSQVPTAIHSEEELNQIKGRIAGLGALQDAALARKGEQAKAAQAEGAAAKDKAEADLNAYRLTLLKGNPVDDAKSATLMDQLFAGKPDLRSKADAIYAAGKAAKPLEPGAGIDAVKAFYDEQIGKPAGAAATIAAETPGKVAQQAALLPGDVKKAAAEARATEPIRARANADAQAYLMKQTGGPLADILDPAERSKVGTEYLRANDAYAEKKADADRLKQFVAAARSGNQSAAGLMTISELRSVVNRVNTTELQQAGGGAVIRRIENGLDKAGEGVPSEDTLKELEAVADLNDKTAQGAFGQKVRGIKVLSPKAKLSETPIGAAAAPKPIALKDGTFLTPHDAAAEVLFRKDHPDLIK